MKKTLIILLLLSLCQISDAASTIGAVLLDAGGIFLAGAQRTQDWLDKKPEKNNYFPEHHYGLHNVRLYDLHWIREDGNPQALLVLPGPYNISASGNLDLESYDPESGRFKYKLTFTARKLIDQKMLFATGPKIVPVKLQDKVIFASNAKNYMYVEGILMSKNGYFTINNIHTNHDNSGFNLNISNDGKASLMLTPMTKIPVILTIEE